MNYFQPLALYVDTAVIEQVLSGVIILHFYSELPSANKAEAKKLSGRKKRETKFRGQ